MKSSIKITFWLLVAVFVLIMIGMMVPPVASILFEIAGPFIVFSELIIFVLLGAILIILTLRNKVEGKIKKFLLLTGISAIGFPVFVVLHNLTSGLLSMVFNKEIEEPVFFILATIICPIAFLFGAIGSITIFLKKKNL